MNIVSQVALRPHKLVMPALALAAKYRPFALRLLQLAGVAPGDPAISRARAIVGWIAANAIHPSASLHPVGWAKNLSVLPVGETWASFNTAFDNATAITRDNAYWYALYPAGGAMLERLIGTVAADGTVADDGMLAEYQAGSWRIRNFDTFRAPQCTLQCKMAQVLLGAIGIPTLDITTVGHDPMAFYDIEGGRWLYIDPTFGEMMTMGGEYLSPLDLVALSLAGKAGQIVGERLPNGADYLGERYFQGARLPAGMSLMTVYVDPQWAGGFSMRDPYSFGNLPGQAGSDPKGAAAQLMPELGCGFAGATEVGRTVEVRLMSNWPEHIAFERSTDRGASWGPVGEIDYLQPGAGTAWYRSVDASGFAGTLATLRT